jgi:hypothetical protein
MSSRSSASRFSLGRPTTLRCWRPIHSQKLGFPDSSAEGYTISRTVLASSSSRSDKPFTQIEKSG